MLNRCWATSAPEATQAVRMNSSPSVHQPGPITLGPRDGGSAGEKKGRGISGDSVKVGGAGGLYGELLGAWGQAFGAGGVWMRERPYRWGFSGG